ncbi:MAG: hypothetical protein WAN14_04030 [Candidatus Acidiferrales bacterium]
MLPMVRAQTDQRPLSKESPLWSLTAKQVGYSLLMFKNFLPTVGGDRVRIQFLDGQRLALAWLTPDKVSPKLIGVMTHVPSHLHLAILDAQTGQKLVYHDWECSSVGVNIAYTASGQWLLASDQSVTLYSPSFDKVRDLRNARTQMFHTFISPSGRTFLVHTKDSGGARSTQLRDSTTFEVLDSWNDALVADAQLAYSDHFVLARITEPRAPQHLYLREPRGSWKAFAVAEQDSKPARGTTYGFVNQDALVGFAGQELVLETVGGTELFRSTVPEPGLYMGSWSSSATSMKGERFAVILDRLRGLRIEMLDMYPFQSEDRIIVYGIPQRGAIFSVKVKGLSPWRIGTSRSVWNRIALSPEGQMLGIVSDEGVRVYALPPIP